MYSNEHTLQDLLKKAYRRLDMEESATELDVQDLYDTVVGASLRRAR